MVNRVVRVILDPIGVEQGSKRAVRSLNRVERSSKGAARAAKLLGGALVAALAAASAKLFKDSINNTRDFSKAISNLSAITGAVGEDLEFLTQRSKDLGAVTTLSATQVAEGFKLVASAKPDLLENADALAAVTANALTLAEAAGTTVPDAAKTLGSALNQFSADADEANRFVNVLAAGAKFGASEIVDTAEALKTSGVVAKAAGLSFEQANAAIQLLAEGALKGSRAGNQLKTIFLRLQSQANDEFNPAIVGLSEALFNLRDAGLSVEEQTKLIGLESVTAFGILLKSAEKVDVLTDKLTGTNTALIQAVVNNNNLKGDNLRLASSYENLTLSLGGTLEKQRQLVQVTNEIVTAFNDWAKASNFTLDTTGPLQTIMQTLSQAGALTVSTFQQLVDSMGGIGAAAFLIASGDFATLEILAENLRKELNLTTENFNKLSDAIANAEQSAKDAQTLRDAIQAGTALVLPPPSSFRPAGSQESVLGSPDIELERRRRKARNKGTRTKSFTEDELTQIDNGKTLLEQLKRERELRNNVSKLAEAEYEIKILGLDTLNPKLAKQIRLLAEEEDILRREEDELAALTEAWEKLSDTAIETQEKRAIAFRKTIENEITADNELRTNQLDNVERVREAGELYNKEQTKTIDLVSELGLTFESTFEKAIQGGESFSDVMDALARDILTIATRLLVIQPIVNSIFGGGGLLNGIGGVLNPATRGGAGGAVVGGGNLNPTLSDFNIIDGPRFASGGSFMVGGNGGTDSSLVQFLATRGERVDISTPNQQRNVNPVNITVNNNVGGVEASVQSSPSGEDIEIMIEEISSRSLAEGSGRDTLRNSFGIRPRATQLG